jgi:Icc-related predicted phosphoesterase
VTACLFATDLHGSIDRYEKLFRVIEADVPAAVFLGGDLLPAAFMPPSTYESDHQDFVNDFLAARLEQVRRRLGERYPEIFVILGNDDGRFEEAAFLDLTARGIWRYAHGNAYEFAGHRVYGYSYVPPTPFQLKDWERYDVSRYVDPGCVPPDQGVRTVPVEEREIRYATITEDLDQLVDDDDLERAVFLFHTPPYQTKLDRADLDGKMVDHAPLDVHVGSIAVQRFIQARQPLLTLHGHIHESTRLTGAWRDRIGRTHMFNGAHDGEELALIRFDLGDLARATRELI